MFYFFNHIDFGQSCQYSYLFFLKFQNLFFYRIFLLIHVPVQPALSSKQANNLPTLVPINLKKQLDIAIAMFSCKKIAYLYRKGPALFYRETMSGPSILFSSANFKPF